MDIYLTQLIRFNEVQSEAYAFSSFLHLPFHSPEASSLTISGVIGCIPSLGFDISLLAGIHRSILQGNI